MRTLFTVLVLAGMATAQTSVDVKVRTQAPPAAPATVKREIIEWVPVRRVVECPGCPVPVREEVTLVRKVIVIEEEAPPPVVRVVRPAIALPVSAPVYYVPVRAAAPARRYPTPIRDFFLGY